MPLNASKAATNSGAGAGCSMEQDDASYASHVSLLDAASKSSLHLPDPSTATSTATAVAAGQSAAAAKGLRYESHLRATVDTKSATRSCYSSDNNISDEEEMLRHAGFRSAFRASQHRLHPHHRPSLTSRIYHRQPPLIKQWGTALAKYNTSNAEEQMEVHPPDPSSSPAATSSQPSLSSGSSHRQKSKSDSQYWIYASRHVKRIGKDVGYSVCDHTWYDDAKPLRASPSFTSSELSSLVPVTAIEACRHNQLTILREMRVKVKNETMAELNRVMKSVTGEIDMKVLRLCETGELAKVQVYRIDDYNYTLISTEKILSGEPLGCWMGTLREKNTFVQRVGFESSFLHICSYEINGRDLPAGYEGPDLVVDATMYGNESRFFRDPKWSHQHADANVTCRISWNQLTGLPYLVYVALTDIPPHAELFLDWGDKCWMNIWRTQLTALSTNSHLAHMYLKSLQRICIDRGINPLPQLANSKFAIAPLPFDKENEQKNLFLDEELSPFASTSATTLSKNKKSAAQDIAATSAAAAASAASAADAAAVLNAPVAAISPAPEAASDAVVIPTPAVIIPTVIDAPLVDVAADTGVAASGGDFSSGIIPTPLEPMFVISTPLLSNSTIPLSDVSFDHREADAAAAVIAASEAADAAASERFVNQHSSGNSSTPSSPFTPSFNNHKAFCATTSHTMLTVFARAVFDAQTREQLRMRRRLKRHRLNQYRPKRKPPKPMVEGAMHVKGQHTFEIVPDPSIAFIKSGTRMGRESKVAVSEPTKELVAEAFSNLRAQDFPCSKDAAIIESGCVPKAAVYEVVGLKHPARFFTRPDQSPFSLVATSDIPKFEAIGAYLGVFREFEEFHKVSDSDAMKQVFAYDCLANKVPGPPNPFLNEEQKSIPRDMQLAYRGKDMIVESLYYGNEIRFMNDAYGRAGMDGAVNASATIVWDKEREWPCILIRALHAIEKGDEIVCDYGDGFWNKVSRSLMMDHAAYGDEIQILIEQTEAWVKAHGLPLPHQPRNAEELPEVFTQNIEKDVVIYPRFFLKSIASDSEGSILTFHQAADALRLSKRSMSVKKVNKNGRGRQKGTKLINGRVVAPQSTMHANLVGPSQSSPALPSAKKARSSSRRTRVIPSLRRELEGAVKTLHQEMSAFAQHATSSHMNEDSDVADSDDELPLLTSLRRQGHKRKSKSSRAKSDTNQSFAHNLSSALEPAQPTIMPPLISDAPLSLLATLPPPSIAGHAAEFDLSDDHPAKLQRLE